MMESDRASAFSDLVRNITYRIGSQCSSDSECPRAIAFSTAQLREMQHVGLFPIDRSLAYSLARFSMLIAEPTYDPSLATCEVPGSCGVGTWSPMLGHADVYAACSGLCLDCVKAGGKNEGKCRIKHA